MSEVWTVIPSEIVQKGFAPRILNEIQDLTSQLYQQFSNSREPITDDNHVLHKLCVKLEYLLQTCMKDKSLLRGNRHYWHWMYDCLKRTKGLSDGLKFVRANKEVRTAEGRGRALIRYSLVHQTLADSFQNCLMNEQKCSDYLRPSCILMTATYCTILLNALYELNAVHFDLISKGYDLDSAWPTFASRRQGVVHDQWRLPSDRAGSFGSLGSYVSHMTSVSMIPENRTGRIAIDADCRGTVSSGPPSVDHRVEELVLELNETDQKIQEQEETLKRLENEANTAAKSASERQDILARVISDLESRNQHLQSAMGQMSTEFQNRERSWEVKYRELKQQFEETEEVASKLKNRISVLEEDKRDLEDTVSARMTMITSGFSGTNSDTISMAGDARDFELAQTLRESENERKILEDNLKSLRTDLAALPGRIEAEKAALAASLTARFEGQENQWRRQLETSSDVATESLIRRLSEAMQRHFAPPDLHNMTIDEKVVDFENKLTEVVNEVLELRLATTTLQRETIVQKSREEELESETTEIIDNLKVIRKERDDGLSEIKIMRDELVNINKKLQNLKLKHEAELSDLQKSMVELKEVNFNLQESAGRAEAASKSLKEENRLLQQQCDTAVAELKSFKFSYVQLEEEYDQRSTVWENAAAEEKSKYTKDLEDAKAHFESQASSDRHLLEASVRENEELKKQVERWKSEIDHQSLLIEEKKAEVDILKSSLTIMEEKQGALNQELISEKEKNVREENKNLQLSAAITNVMGGFENTEKQYEMLNENLSKRESQSAEAQMNAIKVCIETERVLAKKEYDELSGENESRKRMVTSLEKQLTDLQEENSLLTKKQACLDELKANLKNTLVEKEEFEKSFTATEQELIKTAEKLESERVLSIELRKEISNRMECEERLKKDMQESESVSNELKAKLIQLVQEKDALWKELDELKYFQKLQEDGEQTEARWMEDQEVRYCLHCGVEFSIIVRKHHCRVCGKIFCKKCSKQWIKSTDGKLERCCLGCLERHRNSNEIKALTGGLSSPKKSPVKSNSSQGSNLSLNNAEFDTITDEELFDSRTDDNASSSAVNSSIYVTADAGYSEQSRDSISSIPYDETESDVSKEVTIAAGDSLRLPFDVTTLGTTISWKFSSDKNIDFQVSFYDKKKGEIEQILIQKYRCDSNINPIEERIVAKDRGTYVLEFDNKFSRFTSKWLKYSIRLKKPN